MCDCHKCYACYFADKVSLLIAIELFLLNKHFILLNITSNEVLIEVLFQLSTLKIIFCSTICFFKSLHLNQSHAMD